MKKPCKCIRYQKLILVYMLIIHLLLCVGGCAPTLSSAEQVKEFEEAGPIASRVEIDSSTSAKFHTGPYKVVTGDILELHIPPVLRVTSAALPDPLQEVEPYMCRVSDAGTINLPIIGEIAVAGKRLAEIELSIVNAYFPKYVVTPPSVVCKVAEYEGENARVFAVMGLVKAPDTFSYPPNVRYNLMDALAFAGGFDPVADPRYVKIYRKNTDGKVVCATFGINEKSFADSYNVVIKPGDVVYVDHTLRTRVNTFLSDVLSIGVGADVRYKRE